jgi:hypothetical protein
MRIRSLALESPGAAYKRLAFKDSQVNSVDCLDKDSTGLLVDVDLEMLM